MLKKLKTSYSEFINENLYINSDFQKIIVDLSTNNKDVVASLLMYLFNSDAYPSDSDVNFISLSDEINFLKYPPKNRRNSSGNIYETPSQTNIRIGRLVRRIISGISKIEIDYEGKAIFKDNILSFVGNEQSSKLREIALNANFNFIFGHSRNTMSTSAIIDFGDNQLEVDFINIKQSYNSMSRNIIDYIFASNKSFDVEGEHNVKIKFTNKFYGKKFSQINDSDIETFVNEVMAKIKMSMSPEDAKIKEVNGNDIAFWYKSINLATKIGQLGSSCMVDAPDEYFNIYTKNKNIVSLLILTNNDDKLVGRALLWKLSDGNYFMDRVYCLTQYDEKIFTQYAIDNNYMYRNNGNNNIVKYYKDGQEIDKVDLVVYLTYSEFDYYPYLDTLQYLYLRKDRLTNNYDYDYDYELTDTEGRWSGYEEDYYDEDDDY
jgi:translation elongation factor EF-1beta